MSSKDKVILKKLEEDQSISLRKFLMFYCGIDNRDLLSHKITHKDIKFLLPNLKRVSFDFVLDNIKEIYIGSVIIVKDSNGNCAPYINPKINEYIDNDIEIEIEKEKEVTSFETVINLENLNLYELVELAKKYKADNRVKEYRKLSKIIKKKKGEGIEIYHKNKEKIMIKERKENDEY